MGKSEKNLAMKVFLVFCFLAAASAKPQGSPAVGYADGRIIGGEEAPAHEFPWQISLRNLGSHICGGSIINKNQVITAAHCVEGALPALDSVVAGAHHRILEGGHQTRRVAKIEYHASWNNPPFNNDVALITVSEPFDFSDPNVQPIEMMKSSVDGADPSRDYLQQHWLGAHQRCGTLPPKCPAVGPAPPALSRAVRGDIPGIYLRWDDLCRGEGTC